MNRRKLILALAALAGCLGLTHRLVAEDEPYEGSRFGEVWDVVASDPYDALPNERVTLGSFFFWGRNLLLDAARRTVSDRSDVLPRFDKLLHPSGICLAGTWNITEPNVYTGYFEEGRSGLIVARASVALSDTTLGSYRGFGLAGKIWPTLDEYPAEPLETANFFTVDDLLGTKEPYFLDALLTNEPEVNPNAGTWAISPLFAPIVGSLSAADRNPFRRPLYPIAELGLAEGEEARAPYWIKFVGAEGTRVDAYDFRDELRMSEYEHGIVMDIYVAEKGDAARALDAVWQRIGFLEFTRSVASDSCDHRLHFSHPRLRD